MPLEEDLKEEAPTLAEVDALGMENSAKDTMRAVWEQSQKADDDPSDDEPAATEIDKDTQETAPTRDEKGRFVAKDGKGETAPVDEAAAAADDAAEISDPDEPDAPEGEPDLVEPPHEWAVDQQEAFRKLDPTLQAFLMEKINAAQEAQQVGERYNGIDQIIAPHRQKWETRGLDDASGLRQALAVLDWADREPEKYLQWFLDTTGLVIEPGGGDAAEETQYDDPILKQFQERIDQLEGTIQHQNAMTEQQREQSLQSARDRLRTEVDNFADERDANGRLLHPYFGEVRSYMRGLMEADPSVNDLQTAYDMACRAHSTVSAKIASAAKAAEERERQLKDRKKAESAKRAGTSITGDPPGNAGSLELTGDSREDLTRQFKAAGLL